MTKFSRVIFLAFFCLLTFVGRSTSSPSNRAALLGDGGRGSLFSMNVPNATGLGARAPSAFVDGKNIRTVVFVPPSREIPAFEPPPDEPEPEPQPSGPRFRGELDDKILTRICSAEVKSLRPLGGGASIKLRVTFADGSQAAVKPNQVRITRYRAEVAAYRVGRHLGLGVVPPSCVRVFTKEQLVANMPKELRERMDQELLVEPDGTVKTAVIQWVPGLRNLRLEQADWWRPLLKINEPIPAGKQKRIAEISVLLLFDYLLLNHDRWSGGNTTEAGGDMIFIDQGAGFGPDKRHGHSRLMLKTLKWSERFPRWLVQALFRLDLPLLRRELSELLTDDEWKSFVYRVEHARAYLKALKKQYPKDFLF